MRRLVRRTMSFLDMIKIAHTVFALPFAIGAAFLAAGGVPPGAVLGKIVLAVFFARTAAMAFNRIADRRIDAANPRTAARALPRGVLSVRFVATATVAALAGFFATAAWINPLAFRLSPVAAAIILGYSLTKRWTALCHLVLGAGLALAPAGAWVAVTGRLGREAWLLGLVVLLWTAGFDIIYAAMDHRFDRRAGLHSIPARMGVPRALVLSALLHLGMVATLLALWQVASLGWVFLGTVIAVVLLLVHEHRLVRPDDLSRVNRAFFAMNGVISILLMGAMIVESLLP